MSWTNNRINCVTLVCIARNFYGHLGIQLHEFSSQDYTSIVRVFANIAIAFVTMYGIIVLDCFSLSNWHQSIERKKLFFAMLLKLVFQYAVGFCWTVRFAYYLYGGPRIVRVIDCAYLRAIAARHLSPRANKIVSIVAIGGNHLIMMCAFYFNFNQFHNLESSMTEMVQCLAIYVHMILAFFEFQLLHYFQWICLCALTDIETDLRRHYLKSPNCESKAIEQIKMLADLNHELNLTISFPVMIFLLISIADTIIIVCYLIVHFQWTDFYMEYYSLFLLGLAFYFVYIVNLNHRCRSMVWRICERLRDLAEDYEIASRDSRFPISMIRTIHTTSFFTPKSKHSQMIRSHEIEQYCDAFQLRIFRLTPLDMSTLFACFLFILSYVIFIVQTN